MFSMYPILQLDILTFLLMADLDLMFSGFKKVKVKVNFKVNVV